ncbi:unnamed protein product [Brugia pahangi]|uniref:Transthyretin-like family protein n=1 Tax=Brugia pahangi TaxID=6280 RepID=A0A0N4T859_BRUPA|nr:unnamed protein product [Brugia pahangi]
MAKLLVYIAFIIYCQAGNQAQPRVGGAVKNDKIVIIISSYLRNVMLIRYSLASILGAEIITDYKVDKLWDDGSLIQTTQVEELVLSNCDRMEDGRVSILEEKPLLFLLVYIAFIIYCGRQAANPVQPGPGVAAAEIITDYKVDKLWDDGSLIQTTQVEECMLIL